jgi:hypothetical protein
MIGGYHIVVATNCLHATRRLEHTLGNVRQMLREDGTLILRTSNEAYLLFGYCVGLV